eukprot:6150957-Amphidinium_carterae.1
MEGGRLSSVLQDQWDSCLKITDQVLRSNNLHCLSSMCSYAKEPGCELSSPCDVGLIHSLVEPLADLLSKDYIATSVEQS